MDTQVTRSQRTRKLILLADDSATQAHLATQALENAGFRVRTATNGRDALEQARRWQPDLIVSDILMPIMDGFALCREVRRDPMLAGVPIVLHTVTYLDAKDEEFARALGATRYVVKPTNLNELVLEVRSVLATGHSGDPTLAVDDDTVFLQGYSERLAAKLESKVAELEKTNARLEQQNRDLEAARDRLALLLETSQLVASTLNLEVMLERLAEKIVAALQVTFCRISILDAEGARLLVKAASPIRPLNWSVGVGEQLLLADAPLHREVLASGTPRVIQIAEMAGSMSEVERAAVCADIARTVVLIPFAAAGQSTGLVWLGEARTWERSPVSTQKIELAQMMAAQSLLASENVQLHQVQVEAEREARILAEVTTGLATAASYRQSLGESLARVEAAFGLRCAVHIQETIGGPTTLESSASDPTLRAHLSTLLTRIVSADRERAGAPLEPIDVLFDDRLALSEDERHALAAAGSRVVLATRLALPSGGLGGLIAWRVQPGPPSAAEASLVKRIATRIEQASEQRRLRDEIMSAQAVTTERNTLRATLEASQDAVVILNTAHMPQASNLRFEQWFGLSAQDLEMLPVAGLTGKASRVLHRSHDFQEWVRKLLAEATITARTRVAFAEGPVLEAECFSAPVHDEAGEAIGRVFIFHDLSREVELARVRDEIYSVVSHEVRTPLASLVGFAELLLARNYGEEERRHFLTIMLQEGRRLTVLINDFLDMQRMESGRAELRLTAVDPRTLIQHSVSSSGEDDERPIVVEMDGVLPEVVMDADRIQQVLMNLLSNARKYSPQGGEVRLSARVYDGQLLVIVADQGLGLPPEAQLRLFEKFYRVENSDRRSIRGTGLGLAICKKIVESHGGRIWAESDGLGQGSRFCFTLPVAVVGASSGDVLVVEDDAGFAKLLEVELAARGISAVWARSAEDAVAQLIEARPRAVLLDLVLPALQGEELLQCLRADGDASLPVIVVTMKELDSNERRLLAELRVAAVLRKGPGVANVAADRVAAVLAQPPIVAERR